MKDRTHPEEELRNAFPETPPFCRDALLRAARSVQEEPNMKKATFRTVLIVALIIVSTVTAALCVRALGKENVYGVLLPDGEQKDISDSICVCETLGIQHIRINIRDIHEDILGSVGASNCMAGKENFIVPYSKEADINVAPRLRMTVLRYITQALGARLAGTGNLSEMTVGYCTKDGDTSCDFSVLGDLTSVEVVQVGLTMPEIPRGLVLKTPSDGLSGMSDEEKLGVSYEDIHKYIRGLEGVPQEAAEKIQEKQKKNAHKRQLPPLLHYSPTIRDEF